MDPVDVDALFLGPKSENRRYFQETLEFLVEEHVHWRRNFHPEDPPIVGLHERRSPAHEATLERTSAVLFELSSRLKTTSMPWFSPRYLGHMNADTMMAATLAYAATILYNPNNVAYESSPATSELEVEVGRQFARLFGYDPERAWGHVAADGTVANYEGLWVARNLASAPFALREVEPGLVEGLDDWALSNLPTDRILDLLDAAEDRGSLEDVRERTARGTGVEPGLPGKIVVPASAHYSLEKAADLLGIGHDDLVRVPVDAEYRMDVACLEETIESLVSERTPVLAVVPVVGTTEEGAVDPLHEVVSLRDELEDRGVSFYVHVDAAYGGYGRTACVEDGEFVGRERARKALHEEGIVHEDVSWPPEPVYDAFRAFPAADSITVDPHKMGYVPYAAGGFVVRDERVLELISYTAPYVFEAGAEGTPATLGRHILEGSKPGATAAAVWAANRVSPLDRGGYGQLVGRSVEGALRLYESLVGIDGIEAGGEAFAVAPLTRPDLNIVDFAFGRADDDSLAAANALNRALYGRFSYRSGPVYRNDFVTSKTTLDAATYGDAPVGFLSDLGIPAGEWEEVGEVTVLRSCVMTPYLAHGSTYEKFWGDFHDAVREGLADVTPEGDGGFA